MEDKRSFFKTKDVDRTAIISELEEHIENDEVEIELIEDSCSPTRNQGPVYISRRDTIWD